LEVGEGQEKTASGEAGFEAARECIFAICYRKAVSSSTRALIAHLFWATTGIHFEEQGGKVRRRESLKWVLRVRAMEKATLHICRGLPPRRICYLEGTQQSPQIYCGLVS
jgi:hypothetical protein